MRRSADNPALTPLGVTVTGTELDQEQRVRFGEGVFHPGPFAEWHLRITDGLSHHARSLVFVSFFIASSEMVCSARRFSIIRQNAGLV